MKEDRIVCLSCGVFKEELEELIRRGDLDCRLMLLDSMLHMEPALLERKMEEAMASVRGGKFLIVYGDCHPRMEEMDRRNGCARVEGLNCCDIFLGGYQYKKCQRDQAFLFLPEWTRRWREIFHRELGLDNQEVARSFMQELRKRLVYVHTGVAPIPEETLREIEAFFCMPVEILPISLAPLKSAITKALFRLKGP